MKRCWDSSPKRRPEFDVIRGNIDTFYRGSSGRHDDYYSASEVARGEMYTNGNNIGAVMTWTQLFRTSIAVAISSYP